MNAVLELLIFSAFMVLLGLTLVDNIKQRLANKKLRLGVTQGLIDLMAIQAKLEDSSKNNKIEETEGFLKFVSDSRDWAFQYIERVQIAIKNFQDIFHPIATEYYKDKEKPIGQDEFGKLFEAYKKLVDELPDEGKKK